MPRMRTIKPGFFTNEDLSELDPLARILFAGLWCWADREGRLEDRPRRLKAEILPFDDVDVDVLIDQLAAGGFVERYAVNGRGVIRVVAFGRHQNPHRNERPSALPAPGESGSVPHDGVRAPEEDGHTPALGVPTHEKDGDAPEKDVPPPEMQHTAPAGHGLPVHGPWDPAQQETVEAGVSLSAGAPAGARERKSTHPVLGGSAPRSPPAQSRAEARARRALLRSLEEVERFGPPANSVEAKRRGAAADALLASSPPVTPDEVPLLVERWDQDHDPAFCTPMALAGNLTQLRSPPANQIGRRRGAPFRPGAWDRPPPPPRREWRELNADGRPSDGEQERSVERSRLAPLRDRAEGLAP